MPFSPQLVKSKKESLCVLLHWVVGRLPLFLLFLLREMAPQHQSRMIVNPRKSRRSFHGMWRLLMHMKMSGNRLSSWMKVCSFLSHSTFDLVSELAMSLPLFLSLRFFLTEKIRLDFQYPPDHITSNTLTIFRVDEIQDGHAAEVIPEPCAPCMQKAKTEADWAPMLLPLVGRQRDLIVDVKQRELDWQKMYKDLRHEEEEGVVVKSMYDSAYEKSVCAVLQFSFVSFALHRFSHSLSVSPSCSERGRAGHGSRRSWEIRRRSWILLASSSKMLISSPSILIDDRNWKSRSFVESKKGKHIHHLICFRR